VLKTETGSASGPVLFTSCKMVYTQCCSHKKGHSGFLQVRLTLAPKYQVNSVMCQSF